MSHTWLNVGLWLGLAFTVLGGIGMHILDRFSGRSLESYCRLRRKRERFGEILDWQEQAVRGAHYLHLIGLVLALPSATLLITLQLGWLQPTNDNTVLLRGTWQQAIWLLTAGALLLMLISLWLPQVIARYGSAVFVYHTWPAWLLLARVTTPLSTMGAFFSYVGHRLTDEEPDEDFEEEILEDEIRTIVAAGERDGLVGEGVREMIQGVMNLDEADVTSIMTPRSVVDALDVSLPWPEVLRFVIDAGRTRIPVYEQTLDNVVGILFVKDLLPLMTEPSDTAAPKLREQLRKPWFIPNTRRVDELLRDFLHNRNHMAVVIDDYNQMVGVVTIEDALEEIVGEIADELDDDEDSEIRHVEEGRVLEAAGRVAVSDLIKETGWDLPESDDYDSIAGLVISQLGLLPSVGTELTVGDVKITVVRANKRQISRVRIQHVDADLDDPRDRAHPHQ